jgi:hypothetical protein
LGQQPEVNQSPIADRVLDAFMHADGPKQNSSKIRQQHGVSQS